MKPLTKREYTFIRSKLEAVYEKVLDKTGLLQGKVESHSMRQDNLDAHTDAIVSLGTMLEAVQNLIGTIENLQKTFQEDEINYPLSVLRPEPTPFADSYMERLKAKREKQS